jgi:hypothetical protein
LLGDLSVNSHPMAPHGDLACHEIHVRPAQAGELAAAQAGEHGHIENHAEPVTSAPLQEDPHGLGFPDLDRLLFGGGPVCPHGGISRDELIPCGRGEDG